MKRISLSGIGLIVISVFLLSLNACNQKSKAVRTTQPFIKGWKFALDLPDDASVTDFADADWRTVDLPHDWTIEGEFSQHHPATPGGGALPGGTGWYRKTFSMPDESKGKLVFVEFDGVYQNSEVWINGNYLGMRPNGYISFRYELSPYLNYGDELNVLAVKVDNSVQPNSRWYSGSGIYRDVRLVTTNPVSISQWGTYVTTPEINSRQALVRVSTMISNRLSEDADLTVLSQLLDREGKKLTSNESALTIGSGKESEISQEMYVSNPELWSVDDPVMYTLVTKIKSNGRLVDEYETPFGIRYFEFHAEKGFSLNGKAMKIRGVCNHHDLGCLGAAAYPRAVERQLEILKEMGCNAIRTSHNPPAPVLLDLCDRMGFLVMDETFDMWELAKTKYDYSMYWKEWHERDLTDHVLRDRNHPGIVMWSIGNEILEQWDSTGILKARKLAGIVRELDDSRPITSGCNEPGTYNFLFRSGALDIIGFNYHLEDIADVPKNYPGKAFIAAETTSALATRGHYDMPSDGIRVWPQRDDSTYPKQNRDNTCSAYDNCHVPWGSTHEAALVAMNNNDFVSGIFVWTGFDYLGEPTPYWWPSRSSYFGIIDLAGFPKDAFYLYQSEWTDKPVLHLFPHWNWEKGDLVDAWVYTNCSEVELFLNDRSLGTRTKPEGSLHMQWRVAFEPGTLKAVGSLAADTFSSPGEGLVATAEAGDGFLEATVETAGAPARIELSADRSVIEANDMDLAFITVRIVDEEGRLVPDADNLVRFDVEGDGKVIAVDNGLQTSMESFVASERKAFNGLCLAVVRSNGESGTISLQAVSEGLEGQTIEIIAR